MAVEKTNSKTVQKSKDKQLKVTLVRSVIGRPQKQREVVKGLGLRRISSSVVRKDCPEIRGMIQKIVHLVKVEAID
ncbi:MAG: 50S ribosomal protein L30 [Candidatus Aminicenantes bacterium]|jgi:large subunit ribosomal protein L30|nr:50S ribosomal protein L30 [Candidatus Aminicenantes bacterium]